MHTVRSTLPRLARGTGSGIRLYNTMTRRKEELRPLEAGRVSIYSCGPTVYRFAHIGNLRTYMFADVLTRSLEYLGHDAHQVMNITDVGHLTDDSFDRGEDKMLVSARLEKKSPEEIADYYTEAFMHDARMVNIRPAREYPRATAYIPQMIEIIAKLIERGHAYEVGGTPAGRLHALEGSRREPTAGLGQPLGSGIPGLAHRVLGDVDVAAGRSVRHSHRWVRQRISSPRG